MPDLVKLLVPPFPAKHINAALRHFENSVSDWGQGNWEDGIGKTGKFIEAILKGIAVHCRVTFQGGRRFKADAIINALANIPPGTQDDALRLLVPRACRLVYDIASNRGGRHDPDEIDPNSMDANIAMSTASWILAEVIRYAQKGAVDPTAARDLVESLVAKKYPVLEEVDGRIYLHANKKSAVDVILVILARRFPRRVHRNDLMEMVKANGFSEANAKVAVKRASKYADDDGQGYLRILATGRQRADEVIGDALRTRGSG